MDKLIYIPGDLVMTNGVSGGTAKDVIYRVVLSDPSKIFVLDDGTVLKGIVRLENLEDAKLEDEGYLYYGNSYVYSKDIIPISITPEILEKNGWKKDEECSFKTQLYYEKKFGVKTIFIIVKEENSIVVYDNASMMIIQYVHELQHLLFGLKINHEMKV